MGSSWNKGSPMRSVQARAAFLKPEFCTRSVHDCTQLRSFWVLEAICAYSMFLPQNQSPQGTLRFYHWNLTIAPQYRTCPPSAEGGRGDGRGHG